MCGVWITHKYNAALFSNRGRSFVLHFKKKTGIVGRHVCREQKWFPPTRLKQVSINLLNRHSTHSELGEGWFLQLLLLQVHLTQYSTISLAYNITSLVHVHFTHIQCDKSRRYMMCLVSNKLSKDHLHIIDQLEASTMSIDLRLDHMNPA